MSPFEASRRRSTSRLIWSLIFVVIIGGSIVRWPQIANFVGLPGGRTTADDRAGSPDEHAHDDHNHAAPDDSNSLELSAAAKKNLGLTAEFLRPIELAAYRRTVSIPAVIVARPGRSQIQVSTPLTGVVTHVHAVTGEAVTPGMLLFEIQLTHEELVTAQTEFLKTLGELDVEQQEIARLESVAESGAISGRNLLERKYNRDKLTATLKALREALKLHGLSDRHVDEIEKDRRLLRSLSIVAPDVDRHDHPEELHLSGTLAIPVSLEIDEGHRHSDDKLHQSHQPEQPESFESTGASATSSRPLVIGDLAVIKGQSVKAGDKLCVVSDFETLFIEGQAFDQDSAAINALVEKNWSLTALIPGENSNESLAGLKLAHLGSEVDLHARTLSLFVELPNRLIRDVMNDSKQRFVTWKYRPGQRLQLLVPVDRSDCPAGRCGRHRRPGSVCVSAEWKSL